MRRRLRDYQRSKVYKAERDSGLKGLSFATIHDLTSYVDKLCASAWFRKRWAKKIKVKDGRGTRTAMGFWDSISIPRWARYQLIVLHEIAHITKVFLEVESPHGREFCKRLLELVKHEMGIESYKTLRDSFKKCRVKIRGSDKDWEARRVKKKNNKTAREQEKIMLIVENTNDKQKI